MYNGMGLQTPRGSGTNWYVEKNRFFVRPKATTSTAVASGSGLSFAMVGEVRKADKGIVEHERKRQIQVKLLQLEESLEDLGYTEDEIAERLAEAKNRLEDESSSAERDDDGGVEVLPVAPSDDQSVVEARRSSIWNQVLKNFNYV